MDKFWPTLLLALAALLLGGCMRPREHERYAPATAPERVEFCNTGKGVPHADL